MSAGTTIDLRFAGAAQLTRRLHAMETAVTDMRPAWDVLRERFIKNMSRTFAAEGGNSGKWSPLSPQYGAWKMKRYSGKKILQRTGDLLNSVTSELAIDIRGPQTMILGSDSSYGGYHQTGTRKMPQRKMIDFSEYERRVWVTVIRAHLFAATDGEDLGAVA
jgi:phage gpG-like protein